MEKARGAIGKKIGFSVVVQAAVLLFSGSGICIKLAGKHAPFSFYFILFYCCALAIMFVYAIIWQQILKRVPLTTAYAHRATGVIWSMIWGALLFSETISWNMILGALVIGVGLYLVVTAHD